MSIGKWLWMEFQGRSFLLASNAFSSSSLFPGEKEGGRRRGARSDYLPVEVKQTFEKWKSAGD